MELLLRFAFRVSAAWHRGIASGVVLLVPRCRLKCGLAEEQARCYIAPFIFEGSPERLANGEGAVEKSEHNRNETGSQKNNETSRILFPEQIECAPACSESDEAGSGEEEQALEICSETLQACSEIAEASGKERWQAGRPSGPEV